MAPDYLFHNVECMIKPIGLLQVKRRFDLPALPELIEQSLLVLHQWWEDHGQGKVYLNFPGIGYGGLEERRILPMLQQILDSDQFTIFKWSRK